MHSQARAFLQPTRANIHQIQFNNPIILSLEYSVNFQHIIWLVCGESLIQQHAPKAGQRHLKLFSNCLLFKKCKLRATYMYAQCDKNLARDMNSMYQKYQLMRQNKFTHICLQM